MQARQRAAFYRMQAAQPAADSVKSAFLWHLLQFSDIWTPRWPASTLKSGKDIPSHGKSLPWNNSISVQLALKVYSS
jgi:hypothetical protein